MIQYLQRHLLCTLAKKSKELTHSQRYELEEQVINYHLLSRKNQKRITKLKSTKEQRAQELQEEINRELAFKENTLTYNNLHHIQEEIENLKTIVHEIQPHISQKELRHYKKVIHSLESEIKHKKSKIKK